MTSNQDRLLCGTTKSFQPLGLPFWLAGERWNKTKEIHRGNSRQNYHNLSLNWFAWPLQSHKKCSKNHPKNNPGCIFGPFWTNSPSFLPCFSPKNPNSQQPPRHPVAATRPAGRMAHAAARPIAKRWAQPSSDTPGGEISENRVNLWWIHGEICGEIHGWFSHGKRLAALRILIPQRLEAAKPRENGWEACR